MRIVRKLVLVNVLILMCSLSLAVMRQQTDSSIWLYNTPTSSAQLVISGNGNIGIGTLAPSTKLEVAGTVSASALQVNGSVAASSYSGAGTGLTGTAANFSVNTASVSLQTLYIDWVNVANKPTVVSADMTIGAAMTANYSTTANYSNNTPWTGVLNKPNTLAGYGINDIIITSNYSGNITLGGVITGGTFNGTHQGTWSGNTIAQSYLPATSVSSNYTGAVQISGALTANSFAGAGTGLTGTALALSVGTANIAITANYIDWSRIGNKPAVVSADMIIGLAVTANFASTANAVNWAGVQNKPTTILGYGITDAILTNNYAGNVTLSGTIAGGTFNGTHQGTWSGNTISQSYLPATSVSSNYTGAVRISGTVTANTFAGAGTGLTGTALGLTVSTANIAVTANYIDWNNIGNRPAVVSSDMVIGLASTASYAVSANYASLVPWTGVQSKPTTVGGFGITDGVTTNYNGNVTLNGVVNVTSLVLNGSFASALNTKSTSATLTVADSTVLADANAAPVTITLPLATNSSGRVYNIKKVDSTANKVTVAVSGSDSIDGNSTLILFSQYQFIVLVSNGTNGWVVTGGN